MVGELDALYADGREVSYQALREIPRARERDQGDAAPAPAADPADAQGACSDFQYKDWTSAPGSTVARLARGLEPHARVLPGARALRSRPLRAGRARRTSACFAWIPFGARAPPLRRRGLRDDAAEGDLQRAAAPLRVRAGAAARELSQRPLEDGRAARAAVPRALPPARARRRRSAGGARERVRRSAAARRVDPICARATASAPARRPRCSASIRRRVRSCC